MKAWNVAQSKVQSHIDIVAVRLRHSSYQTMVLRNHTPHVEYVDTSSHLASFVIYSYTSHQSLLLFVFIVQLKL